MKIILATAAVALVTAIGAGAASATIVPYTSPFPAGYFDTPSSAYGVHYSTPSYGGYGSLSRVTGLPRTRWTSPYFRSTGRYVPGYYRSCSYCLW